MSSTDFGKRMATADEMAQVIYGAATDGTDRLR